MVPREIIWLNGAPGSGKGANTPFILKHRGLSRAVAVSSLVAGNADVKKLIDEWVLPLPPSVLAVQCGELPPHAGVS